MSNQITVHNGTVHPTTSTFIFGSLFRVGSNEIKIVTQVEKERKQFHGSTLSIFTWHSVLLQPRFKGPLVIVNVHVYETSVHVCVMSTVLPALCPNFSFLSPAPPYACTFLCPHKEHSTLLLRLIKLNWPLFVFFFFFSLSLFSSQKCPPIKSYSASDTRLVT